MILGNIQTSHLILALNFAYLYIMIFLSIALLLSISIVPTILAYRQLMKDDDILNAELKFQNSKK